MEILVQVGGVPIYKDLTFETSFAPRSIALGPIIPSAKLPFLGSFNDIFVGVSSPLTFIFKFRFAEFGTDWI